jgi:hypothetical protein
VAGRTTLEIRPLLLTPSLEDDRRRERFRALYVANFPLILGARRRFARRFEALDGGCAAPLAELRNRRTRERGRVMKQAQRLDELMERLAPVRDRELRSLRETEAARALFEAIVAEPAPGHSRPRRFRHTLGRRRWRVAVAATAASVLAVVALLGLEALAPPAAAGIEFARGDGYLVARVVDLKADPDAMRAAFQERGLDIDLELVPVSPSLVGEIVASSESEPGIEDIPDPARGCPAEPRCGPIGLRIPIDWDGEAQIVLGRAARPSESYVSAGDAFAPGEALHCAAGVIGATVARARAVLDGRALAVIWHVNEEVDGEVVGRTVDSPNRILDWVVVQAIPASPGSVHVSAEETAPSRGFRRVSEGC